MDTDENPYLLLTPGPLSTTPSVKKVMLRDWCTWDDDYNIGVVEKIRSQLVQLATDTADREVLYTSVLMQGSGTFSVEAVIGSVIPDNGKLLVLANGAYGRRLKQITERLKISMASIDYNETSPPSAADVDSQLKSDPDISHVALVHGETSTGMLNPLGEIADVVKNHNRTLIVDAMCTFGGVPLDVHSLGIDFLISSANKCIQGVPGFGFVVARRVALIESKGRARSLSLDLFDQWETMENGNGKWRYTSPTHTVRAFAQALVELEEEGGVAARHKRYAANQQALAKGMTRCGFQPLLPGNLQSPIITAFHYPDDPTFDFKQLYVHLKKKGFVIYPGKVTDIETFRIGTIGNVQPGDIEELISAVEMY